MQTHTIKTTLTFSPGFLNRLRRVAKQQQRSMSKIVEDALDTIFREQERQRLSTMYTAIHKWRGSGSHGVKDASSTIDETLYGSNGVWRGERDEQF